MDTISDALRMGVPDYLIVIHYQRLQHTPSGSIRYRSSLRSSEQANQTHVDALFNIRAKEQTAEPNSGLRELMKIPSTG